MVNDPAFVPEQYGIAVRKGNAELLAKVNQGLAAIRADGTYDRIHAQVPRPRGDARRGGRGGAGQRRVEVAAATT